MKRRKSTVNAMGRGTFLGLTVDESEEKTVRYRFEAKAGFGDWALLWVVAVLALAFADGQGTNEARWPLIRVEAL